VLLISELEERTYDANFNLNATFKKICINVTKSKEQGFS
jgi:hypothetical protein